MATTTFEQFKSRRWPDGCLGDAEAFFAFIRERTQMNPALVDDAIKVLDDEYRDRCARIGADASETKTGLLFFTGAFLGLKIAEARLKIHLAELQAKANAELARKAVTVGTIES